MMPKAAKRYWSPPGTPALQRFAEKCAFDPVTGCVMWIGGITKGHGHNEPYGRFWDGERMMLAHRWAGVHIHGLDLEGMQADHCCPAGPSTLCVEHVAPETAVRNRFLQHDRPGRAFQDLATKQHWLMVSKGITEYSPAPREANGVPFFEPPAWLRPFLIKPEKNDAPF